jgi:hypothetical protein
MEHELLTPAELRSILKVSKRTLCRWTALGILPPQVAPSRWTRQQIDKWLTRHDEQHDTQKPFDAT